MSGDPFIIQLVTDVLDSDRTPEDVCSQHPELLEEVRRRVDRCRELNSRLDRLFFSPNPEGDEKTFPGAALLPKIPLYQVLAIIGEGGMGVVYSAQHLKLKRVVALKMLRSGAYASPAELGRFTLEAEAIAGLQHPNIVQIYDLGEIEGRPYFTMEYLEGGSLDRKLDGAPLPPADAAKYLVTMATAVSAAHRAGIVHRDLKPANVLFSLEGQLKISDFGLARRITEKDDLTLCGARMGTPSYMAPEQAAGKTADVGKSTDIYALGAILYEMLTGRPPFRGASASETERQVIHDEPAAPRRLNTAVPRDLETICLKCLRKDPSERYATAADLGEDASRYLRGEPIHARPVGAIERGIKWIRRRPAQTISIAASLILVMGLSGGALWFLSARSARTRTVTADLELVDGPNGLERSGKWDEARTELKQAAFELGNHGPREVRERLDRDNHELKVVAELDAIQLRLASVLGNMSQLEIEDAFRPVFKDAGVDLFTRDAGLMIQQIRNSRIRIAIEDAMNNWAFVNRDPNQREWLLNAGLGSHENQTPWEQRLCSSRVWASRSAMLKLAADAPIAQESVWTLVLVGQKLESDGIPFLMEVQRQHPNDFWANLILGGAEQHAGHIDEAIRFLQAAVAIRHGEAVPESNLAYALMADGRTEEAMAHCQIALKLGSSDAIVGINLPLLAMQNAANAIQEMEKQRRAQGAKSGQPLQTGNLARMLEIGQGSDAEKATLGTAFGADALARLQARWEKWNVALDADPANYSAWSGYAELCLYLQHEDEYRRTRTRLLERFGDATDPHTAERAGRACLLLPGSDEEIRKAAALVDRAVNADNSKVESWAGNFFLVAKALAEYRQGHLKEANTILHGPAYQALQPMPQLIMVMVLEKQGDTEAADRLYKQAFKMFDWNPSRATNADAWMFLVLRREAEKMIQPSTQPAIRP